jgi:hypothetical protein
MDNAAAKKPDRAASARRTRKLEQWVRSWDTNNELRALRHQLPFLAKISPISSSE